HQGFGLSSGGSIGGQFAGNMANSLLAGANQNERARGTTQSAIADGAIVVRDRANRQYPPASEPHWLSSARRSHCWCCPC
ncbi:hypothetical protein, partial [Edwardsiella anguillarum]|uniref:hypothetical protein n=1 Tax=Edwardsiella anguillarum TaxID=1821960 RepID=UPI00405A00C6